MLLLQCALLAQDLQKTGHYISQDYGYCLLFLYIYTLYVYTHLCTEARAKGQQFYLPYAFSTLLWKKQCLTDSGESHNNQFC